MGAHKTVYWQVLSVLDTDKGGRQSWRWFIGHRISGVNTILGQGQADYESPEKAEAAVVRFIRDMKDYPVKKLGLTLDKVSVQ